MSKKRNIPEIRFKGFDDEWVNFELGKIAEFNPKADLPDTFEYVDLESVVGTEMIAHRQENKNTAPSRAQRLARQGDLFFQTVRPYQKNNYLFDKYYENYVFSTGYAQIRPEGNGYFLLSLVQNNWFLKTVLDNCTGTSYPAINSTILADIKVSIPDNTEQSRIGSYFQNLDKLINLHQKKYDKLTALKKAMLEKMFPKDGSDVPEIRFKGFTGKWEEKYLGEIADITKLAGFEFTEYVIYSNNGSIIALRGLNVKKGQLVLDEVKYIDQSNFLKLNRSQLYRNDILLTYVGTVGELAIIPEDNRFYLAPNVARIRMKSGFDSQFVIQMMGNKSFYDKIIFPLIATSSQPALSMENVRKFCLKLPKITEQQKIGSYFQNLDKLISLQQKELDKLKNIKKACLEKMFV